MPSFSIKPVKTNSLYDWQKRNCTPFVIQQWVFYDQHGANQSRYNDLIYDVVKMLTIQFLYAFSARLRRIF